MFDFNTDSDDLDFSFESVDDIERSIAAEFPQLADHLRRQGAVLVRLEYSGSEGDGEFLPLRSCDEGYREISVHLPAPMMAELHGLCETLLEERHPDWKRNHGACGDFGWNIDRDTFAHVHRPYEGGTIRHDGI